MNVNEGTVKETENVIGRVEGIVMTGVIVIGTESLNETGIATGTDDAIRRMKTIDDLGLLLKGRVPLLVLLPSRVHRHVEAGLETEPKWRLVRHGEQKRTICERKKKKKRPWRERKQRRKLVKRKSLIR